MGLDIYLYTAEQQAASDAHDKAFDELYKRKERGKLTEEQYDAAYKELPDYELASDVPSEKYPDHLFNRRYLRSSYNDSGFNHAVPEMLGESEGTYPNQRGTLYWIFEPMGREWDGDEGRLTPDDLPKLAESRERAVEVAEGLRKCDPLRAEAVHAPMLGGGDHMWHSLPTEDEVLAWFRQELERSSSFDSYSSAKGSVYKSGLEVLAITLGRDVLGQPSPVIVYRSKAIESYIQSAEIVAEFCDEAISLIKRDGSAYMSWSG